MRKVLHFLFPVAALTIALMGSSRAEAPEVCKGCGITEDQLRAFIGRAQQAIADADMRADFFEHRAASCEAILHGNKT